MASEDYDITDDAIEHRFIHLTNYAVQKFAEKYGEKEDGNQLTFGDLQGELDRGVCDPCIEVGDMV